MKRERLALAAIVALGLGLRLAWIFYSDFGPSTLDDAGYYEFIGRSLAAGAGFTSPTGATTTYWPPGYPLFLGAVYKLWPGHLFGGPDVNVALVANALLGSATVLLVYGIGRRAFDERTALVGALLTAFFPSLIFLAGMTLSETLFIFLALLGLWLAIEAESRPNRLLLVPAGIVVGLAALTRGQAALFPLVLLPFWWRVLKDRRLVLARALTMGALVALVFLPWTVRNYVESKSFVVISTNAGVDFYIGHSEEAPQPGRQVIRITSKYKDLPLPQAEAKISADGFHEGLEYALSHPLREIELSARKLFYLYYNDHEALSWTETHGARQFMPDILRSGLAWLSDSYYFAVLGLAALGAVGWLSRRQPVRLLLVSLVIYWTLVHIVFFGDPRFHAPIIPVVCLWAAVGFWSVRRWWLAGQNTHGPSRRNV